MLLLLHWNLPRKIQHRSVIYLSYLKHLEEETCILKTCCFALLLNYLKCEHKTFKNVFSVLFLGWVNSSLYSWQSLASLHLLRRLQPQHKCTEKWTVTRVHNIYEGSKMNNCQARIWDNFNVGANTDSFFFNSWNRNCPNWNLVAYQRNAQWASCSHVVPGENTFTKRWFDLKLYIIM